MKNKIDNQLPEMVYVEGGGFDMGDVFRENRRSEQPVHEVSLTGFYLGKYEVTVEEFDKFVVDTGYETTARLDGSAPVWVRKSTWPWRRWVLREAATWKKPFVEQSGRDPVVEVSWYDAIAFCNWLSERSGPHRGFRLARSESQFEGGLASSESDF